MSGVLDTSMVVRYLTGDPSALARQAASVIDKEEDLLITGVVIVETAYVLTKFYLVPRQTAVDHLLAFLQKENIGIHALNKGFVLQALLLCRPSGRVSFADALTWATARSSAVSVVYSLDERFPDDGIEVRRGRTVE